jgi:2,4-dienoyl-CoA reductase-like NADH-dependent reductase (Old Yellow Enzyme family)
LVHHADGTTRTIGNRFCVHPMEGWDGTTDGAPTADTTRRWSRFGESGAKLVWGGEAFAVQADGRANPNQLFHNPEADTHAHLAGLLETLRTSHQTHNDRADDLLVGLQLTHSGRFCRPQLGDFQPRIAEANPALAERYGLDDSVHVFSDDELCTIRDNAIRAAEMAADVGFDFVDVKCCHGYLLHELLGARTRSGDYGGSWENRTRLFREIVEGIRSSRPTLMIGSRVSITDCYPHVRAKDDGRGIPRGMEQNLPWTHGFGVSASNPVESDYDEPSAFLALCKELGLFMLNLTIGSPYYCPHLQRPAAYPPSDGYLPPRDPLLEVIRHLRTVREIKRRAPEMPLVGSGYSYLQEWLPHVAEYEAAQGNVDMIGLGRSMLSYPTLPRDVLAGRPLDRKQLCRTFSDCTTGPRNGMRSGCYPLDAEYAKRPEAVEIRVLRKAAMGANAGAKP